MRPTPSPLARQLLWFVGLWMAGVTTVGVVGLAIKIVLK